MGPPYSKMHFGPHPTPSSPASPCLVQRKPHSRQHLLAPDSPPSRPCACSEKASHLRACKGLLALPDKGHPSSGVLPPGPWTSLSSTWCPLAAQQEENRDTAVPQRRGATGPGTLGQWSPPYPGSPGFCLLLPAQLSPFTRRPSSALCHAYAHTRPQG